MRKTLCPPSPIGVQRPQRPKNQVTYTIRSIPSLLGKYEMLSKMRAQCSANGWMSDILPLSSIFFLGESWRLNTLADLSSKLRKTLHLISKFIYSNPTDYSVIDSHPAFRICAYKRKGVTTIKKALNFQSCANFSFHFVQGFFRFIWEPCYNAILAASCFFSSALLGVWITERY